MCVCVYLLGSADSFWSKSFVLSWVSWWSRISTELRAGLCFLSSSEQAVWPGASNLPSLGSSVGIAVRMKDDVLVCSGCHNKNATHWVALTTEFYFFAFLETRSPRSRLGFSWGLSSWLADGPLLTVSSCGLSSCVHMWCLFLFL